MPGGRGGGGWGGGGGQAVQFGKHGRGCHKSNEHLLHSGLQVQGEVGDGHGGKIL